MTVKRFRIRYKRLIIFLLILLVIVFVLFKILSLKITNIYVSGNIYLSDQEVLELAHIDDYPSAIMTFSSTIENSILSSPYIESVKVNKNFTEVYIMVNENRPLFYDDINHRTILKDGSYVSEMFNVPILTSSVDSGIYNRFLEGISSINIDVFNAISEVSYSPNEVDDELFLFTMNDGNYIFVNLDKFDSVDKYFGMITKFNNHKGILYLDSGEYFKILDN